jgi:PHD/YefM family antitoxin component YafN of YafNO toxin-antitoxin module
MAVTTISSREFNQHIGAAKQAASKGPVVITHRGLPTHVLLRFEDYQRLVGTTNHIVDLLAMPGADSVGFEPPRVDHLHRPADLS